MLLIQPMLLSALSADDNKMKTILTDWQSLIVF